MSVVVPPGPAVVIPAAPEVVAPAVDAPAVVAPEPEAPQQVAPEPAAAPLAPAPWMTAVPPPPPAPEAAAEMPTPQSVAAPGWSMPPAQAPAPVSPAAPPPWASAPAATTTPLSPPVPPAYPAGPAGYYPGAPAPAAPATPGAPAKPLATIGGVNVTPKMAAIGGIALAAIVAVVVVFGMGSSSGSITFSPSTVSCKTPVTFTSTANLPSSVKAGDTVTITLDGKSAGTTQVAPGGEMTRNADGSWLDVSTTTIADMQALCAAGGTAGGFNVLTPGTHTMKVLDASGKVLAQGSYTVTP
jgi:hypothetical protein